ncbi:hypothetical protein ACOMHN_052792 [Nucella lapillus]
MWLVCRPGSPGPLESGADGLSAHLDSDADGLNAQALSSAAYHWAVLCLLHTAVLCHSPLLHTTVLCHSPLLHTTVLCHSPLLHTTVLYGVCSVFCVCGCKILTSPPPCSGSIIYCFVTVVVLNSFYGSFVDCRSS